MLVRALRKFSAEVDSAGAGSPSSTIKAKTESLMMPADKPMLSTINSIKPLHDIKLPTAADSRHV
jgi:hypothetical protein